MRKILRKCFTNFENVLENRKMLIDLKILRKCIENFEKKLGNFRS